MTTKKAKDVKITDTKKKDAKKTPKEKLVDEAKALGLEFREDATVTQLQALIQTEKLKADLPAPPPPPPVMSFTKLPNKDIVIKVGPAGPNKGARLLQGLTDVDGEDKWKDLCVISPVGAPRIVLKARVDEATLKLTQKVKKVRLMQGGKNGPELESMKL